MADEKNNEEGQPQVQDHTHTVAKHYNELQESGLAERTKSRIFYLRNFNNWNKSMAIAEYLSRLRDEKGSNSSLTVLDLCSGKGGDLLKWKKGKIDRLVCADIAATSVEQCEVRYKELLERSKRERFPSKTFAAEFIKADCTKKRLKSVYKDPDMKFDLVSCQFSFHYCFESYKQADLMIRNASECLQKGGYFIGTTPNCHELVKRLNESEDMSFGNEVFRVTFKTEDKTNIPLFGAQYDFHLEGVVDCPEFVVYFPAVEKIAARYGMKLVAWRPFAEYFAEQIKSNDGRCLVGRMQALEPYPADEDVELMSNDAAAYSHTQEVLTKLAAKAKEESERDGRRYRPPKVGTLSQAEWEATTVYLMFAFQKVEDICPPFQEPSPEPSEAGQDPTPETSDNEIQDRQVANLKRPLEEGEDEENDDESAAKRAKT